MTPHRKAISHLLRAEDGSASWFSIVPLVFVLIILGLALDVTNATQERTHLQVTADAAAHAALVTRNRIDDATADYFTEDQAKARGIELAGLNMPASQNGNVLNASNVVFGNWDSTGRTFTPNPGSRDAVQVVTQQVAANGNPVSTYMLRLIGFNSWDVRALTTMATFTDQCGEGAKNGFFANGIVDLQSNNHFRDNFCVHSNTHVELNQNNTFEPGTAVTMPDPGDLVIPASGMAHNQGLADALGSDGYEITEVTNLPATIAGLDQATPAYTEGQTPEFVAGISGINNISFSRGNKDANGNSSLGPANLVQGKVNRVACGNNGTVSIAGNAVIENVVIITPCKVSFGQGSTLKNAIVATTSTSAQSVSSANNFQIGGHECGTPGGNAMILTMGGAHFASELTFKGGQIIAAGDVGFPARDVSVEGVAVYAGGRIDGTSNLDMGDLCDDGSETNISEVYFRYVQ